MYFFLKPELTSSLCVWLCVDKTHSGINSKACECWRFGQLCMSLLAPLQHLHSWKTTHSTPFFLPDRTAVHSHKHTLSVLVSSTPVAGFYKFRKQVIMLVETLRAEVSYCSGYSSCPVLLFFFLKAHTANVQGFKSCYSVQKFIRFRGEVFIKYFKQT